MPVFGQTLFSKFSSLRSALFSTQSRRNVTVKAGIGIFISALFLSGCQSTPPQPEITETADSWLQKARHSLSPQREQYQLEAARLLAQQGKPLKAMTLLDRLDPQQMPPQLLADYVLLFSELALNDDSYYLAKHILTLPELAPKLSLIKQDDIVIIRERRAQVLFLLAEPLPSLKERIQLGNLLNTPEEKLQNQEDIWQTLLSIPLSDQKDQLSLETNLQLRGWLELATSVRTSQDDIELQLQAVHSWMVRWPEHPASLTLPSDLQQLAAIVEARPKKVAVLLPTSGKLSKPATAIRDGLMAAHYSALANNRFTPSLFFLDSNTVPLDDVYQQAYDWGADIVIGPLSKDKLSELSQFDELPIPTLALNYNTNIAEPSANLYQFGLAAEDEAKQVAQQAWIEGHRRAMVIHPDNSWGQRSSDAFATEWQALGGEVVAQGTFNNKGKSNYSQAVEDLLHTRSSRSRARNLRRTIGEKFEFDPRRRQDIDMIFMAARPQQGRQLKPTFAFHFASSIPVYSTSQVYSGVTDRGKDRDLNGVRFTALPWFFAGSNTIKKEMSENLTLKPGYGQLYALGIDAYHVYPRLPLLATMANSRHYGLTGTLKLDHQTRRITRQAQWARMKGGRAKAENFLSSGELSAVNTN